VKNIVICCDGTGNEYGTNNTNVVLTYEVSLEDPEQVCFYDPGVGTGGWAYDEGTGKLQAIKDQATGSGLVVNIEDAYQLLMRVYEDGDRVYLFGFSRGAFTVRSLAGMLYKCGLLAPHHVNLLPYASKLYNTKKNERIAKGFKVTFGRPCPVHFIGVWDTVESLVLNGDKWFNDRLNPEVTFGYHAVSIDERRKDFPPALWDLGEVDPSRQTVEQVWFSGVHSDVGGWYDERGLSNTAFQWMLGKAVASGLKVDPKRLAKHKPDPHDEIHESFDGFWLFRGDRRRKIPKNATVHQSVVDRMSRSANGYDPPNLPGRFRTVE